MSEYCVVVSGGARARFFTLEPVDFPELESGPKLIDKGELLNPTKETAGRDLYTDLKTGRSRAPRGGPSHGYDDHRTQHEDEFDRRFARKVAEKARVLAKKNRARRIVLAAPARMLGYLRQELAVIPREGIEVHKVAKDMSKFTPRQIHDHLAKRRLLPAYRKPGV
jgi:protein required for attachment to host cells